MVTANKELLANVGAELFAAAEAAGVDLLFEAAVAGGIPLVRPLRESLLGEPIDQVMGIVNGTTNYILTRMTEAGVSYAGRPGRGPGASATPKPTRPPTSRASTPGPRSPSSPASPSGPRSWPATSTTRASPASPPTDIAFAAPQRLRRSSCWRSPRTVRATAVRARRARAPGHGARPPTRWPSVRDSFNAVFVAGRGGRRPDVLRPRRRRQPDGQRGAGRRDRRRAQPAQGRPAPASARSREVPHPADRRAASPPTT